MRVNADFDQRVVVRFDETPWVPSPMAGVERKMLDRIGDEVARATTIVRFAPGSAFSAHTHDGGEEYLVLDGVFQDELGDFPAGTYVRNPPTSRHTPATDPGCTILVKLHQFDPDDRQEVRVNTTEDTRETLFEAQDETVSLLRLAAGESTTVDGTDGLEVFVIDGAVSDGTDELTRWDWMRLPVDSTLTLTAGDAGATLWTKSGHLRAVRMPVPA